MSRSTIFKAFANTVAESGALNLYKLAKLVQVSGRAMSTEQEAIRGGYHRDLQKDDTKQAINRLAEESARVATETKDRVLGQYDPAKFDSTAPLEDVKAAAADAAREAQATVQSAQSSAADAVHTAQHKVSKMTDGMSETVADVQNKASEATSQAQKEVSDMASAAYEQAAGMSEATKSAAGDVYGRLKSAVENVVQGK